MPIHCLGHSLNLSLQEVSRKIKAIRDSLDVSLEIVNLIKRSPKRQQLLEEIKIDFPDVHQSLKPLCPTRWTVRATAFKAILSNYAALQSTLEIVGQGTDEYARKANGLISLMEKFGTFFGISLCILIFEPAEQVSITLQGKSITAEDAWQAANNLCSHLKRLRSDETFNDFYDNVLESSKNLTDEPTLPRRHRVPARFEAGAMNSHHYPEDPKSHFRQQYFELIDLLDEQISRRFKQDNFDVARSLENFLIQSANRSGVIMENRLKELYAADIDLNRLSTQAQMLPNALEGNFTKVTKVGTLCDLFNEQPVLKNLFSEVHKMMLIYLTLPVTTASSERTFSTLRRVKTYLRATMTQERLNHLLILNTYRERTENLDLLSIAKTFIDRNERRSHYFGKI